MNRVLCFTLITFSFFYSVDLMARLNNRINAKKNNSEKKEFVVYDAMKFYGKPDLRAKGFQSIFGIGEVDLTRRDKSKPPKVILDTNKINLAIDNVIKNQYKMIFTDIEAWYDEEGVDPTMLNMRFHELFTLFKKRVEGITISNYGLPFPSLCLYRANLNGKYNDEILISKWLYASRRRTSVINDLDYFAPSVYIVNPDIDSWIKDLETTVAEIKKLDSNKRIIPFIWPCYYDLKGSPYYKQVIEPHIWKQMLDAIYENCDGVIIWSLREDARVNPWNDSQVQYIYKTTLSFMKKIKF